MFQSSRMHNPRQMLFVGEFASGKNTSSVPISAVSTYEDLCSITHALCRRQADETTLHFDIEEYRCGGWIAPTLWNENVYREAIESGGFTLYAHFEPKETTTDQNINATAPIAGEAMDIDESDHLSHDNATAQSAASDTSSYQDSSPSGSPAEKRGGRPRRKTRNAFGPTDSDSDATQVSTIRITLMYVSDIKGLVRRFKNSVFELAQDTDHETLCKEIEKEFSKKLSSSKLDRDNIEYEVRLGVDGGPLVLATAGKTLQDYFGSSMQQTSELVGELKVYLKDEEGVNKDLERIENRKTLKKARASSGSRKSHASETSHTPRVDESDGPPTVKVEVEFQTLTANMFNKPLRGWVEEMSAEEGYDYLTLIIENYIKQKTERSRGLIALRKRLHFKTYIRTPPRNELEMKEGKTLKDYFPTAGITPSKMAARVEVWLDE